MHKKEFKRLISLIAKAITEERATPGKKMEIGVISKPLSSGVRARTRAACGPKWVFFTEPFGPDPSIPLLVVCIQRRGWKGNANRSRYGI